MRVYLPLSYNCFYKNNKNKTNLMQHDQNNNEHKKHHHHHHYHHYDDDHQVWSLPIKYSYLFAFVFVTLFMQHYVTFAAANDSKINAGFSDGVTKGFKNRMRSPKIASIHILQAVPESLENHQQQEQATDGESVAALADNQTQIPPAGKFEIRSVSGEPNYKSVNLTWEVEFVNSDQDAITNRSAEVEPPTSFQIFFCEIQSFGPHRCRSKVINSTTSLQMDGDNDNDLQVLDKIRQVRQYVAQVDNLRMATKYSFHIRSMPKHKNMKITGRSEIFDNEIENENDFLSNNVDQGQTIIIPTKGFSAQATRCLPTASEIEVETGPYFGGKIVVDGGNCGIKGDPNDSKDKYVMRIDHKTCGSMVKPETNTVETFITVQENLGIFTHSTRRFVVVCSYQSGLQTVRASFSVPGRGGASAVQQDQFEEEERMGRGLRPMRYVDKSHLVLKENIDTETDKNQESSEETEALIEEVNNPKNNETADDTTNAVATFENIIPGVNEEHIKQTEVNENEEQIKDEHEHESEIKHSMEFNEGSSSSSTSTMAYKDDDDDADKDKNKNDMANIDEEHEQFSAKFAKLTLDDEDDSDDFVATPTGRGFGSGYELISLNMGSIMLTVLLSVILIGIFIYVVYRESNLPPHTTHTSPMNSPAVLNLPTRHHQHLHEVEALSHQIRTKNQDLMA